MKIPWYVIFIVGFVAGFIVFWRGFSPGPVEPVVFREYHIERDTIPQDTIYLPKIVKVPVPSGVSIPLTPAPEDLDMIRTYKDSTDLSEDFRLYYDITTRGIITGLEFSALDTRPIVRETVTIKPDPVKPFRGLYIGVTVGGSPDAFNTLGGGVDYVNSKGLYGYYYNVIDRSHNVRVSRRVF